MSERLGWLRGIAKALVVLVVGIVFLFPLYWIVTMAFKPQEEWQPIDGVHWVTDDWTLENFKKIFGRATDTGFFEAAPTDATDSIINSIVAASGGTILAMLVGVFTAYGIARYRAGGGFLPFQILQLRMFPPIAIVIPLLIMYAYLHLVDTYWGLILIYGAVRPLRGLAWSFQEVPRRSRGGDRDGCSSGAFFKAVLPQVGRLGTALFVFILNWRLRSRSCRGGEDRRRRCSSTDQSRCRPGVRLRPRSRPDHPPDPRPPIQRTCPGDLGASSGSHGQIRSSRDEEFPGSSP
jgi:multiple sugar transport system permease protein